MACFVQSVFIVRQRQGLRCLRSSSDVQQVSVPNIEAFRKKAAGEWSGRFATFSARGDPLEEETTRTNDVSCSEEGFFLETRRDNGLVLTTRVLEGEGYMCFEDGSYSYGPSEIQAPLEVESCLCFRDHERVRIIHNFTESAELARISILHERKGKRPPDSFFRTPKLEASEIAGRWSSRNLVCGKTDSGGRECTIAEIERTYPSQASSNPSLVLLPLYISSVAQPVFLPGREYSIGVGWLADRDSRVVMIRRFSSNGKFTRTAYRTEKRLDVS
eukprot:Plantae.Rhodophyta-Purpureofilum_apyrenoidigerum.ctg19880.p1 GENE.Plantae.Rhodophyta-Purpureofilum_apyrenoidigerum.ctg19880~~Plantae.Rhodophyta-Purpureofilum_apyrenoidigerum.ctg19880.p1  ORF type:complete len:274 (+),score=28.75 Plantae.Rhodophyta-Purpureofilum_apyrenoidigerum.ctg19880:100-921(+)